MSEPSPKDLRSLQVRERLSGAALLGRRAVQAVDVHPDPGDDAPPVTMTIAPPAQETPPARRRKDPPSDQRR
jgi:hypothetical protein